MKKYEKLVRDKIPEIIKQNVGEPVTKVLDEEEFRIAAANKLIEESQEFFETPTLEERADIEEVLHALDETYGFSPEDIEAERQRETARTRWLRCQNLPRTGQRII